MSAADLSKAVRARRHELGLTVAALCFGGGPSIATVRNIEQITRNAYMPRTLRAIDTALGWESGSAWNCFSHGGLPVVVATSPEVIDPRDEKALRVGRLVLALLQEVDR